MAEFREYTTISGSTTLRSSQKITVNADWIAFIKPHPEGGTLIYMTENHYERVEEGYENVRDWLTGR
jgi:hypothetical protein